MTKFKSSRRILALIMALVLALSLCPVISLADSGSSSGISSGGTAAGGSASTTTTTGDGVDASLVLADMLASGDLAWSDDGDYYSLTYVYYVAEDAIVDSTYQYMNIYVPADYVTGIDETTGQLIIDEDATITSTNGVTYSAENAPIVFKCEGPGYSENQAGSASTTYLNEGYIYVSPGHRGKNTIADDPSEEVNKDDYYETYDGKSPWALIDSKAAIRYLKYNDDLIPGDSEKIVAFASSGGGALATFIGCNANADVYEDYLREAGAIVLDYDGDTSFTGDVVYAVCGYCPITNVGNADIAYEWFLGAHTADEYAEYSHVGSSSSTTDFQKLLSELMADAFEEYVVDTGVVDTFAEFEDEFWSDILFSINYYIQEIVNGDVELTWDDEDLDTTDFAAVATAYLAGEYTASSSGGMGGMGGGTPPTGGMGGDSSDEDESEPNQTSAGSTSNASSSHTTTVSGISYGDCFAYDEEAGEIVLVDGVLYGAQYSRQKDVTSFDGLAKDLTENQPMGDEDENMRHFSNSLYQVLLDNYDELEAAFDADEENLSLINGESFADLIAEFKADIEGTDDDADCVRSDDYGNSVIDLYNPMCFIGANSSLENDYSAGAETAEYVRLRMGTSDANTALPIITLLRLALENNGSNVDMEFVWEGGHSEIEQSDTDITVWIDEICAPSGSEEPEEPATGNTSVADATVTTLTVYVDDEELNVTMYEDCYVANPNREEDQLISIYIPENATPDSPIMFYVNNSGWQSNAYSSRTQVKDGSEYSSTSDSDKVGVALSEGYVIVSYGARSRNNGTTTVGDEELYLGHSPATMTDTKAAIRYLRYNADVLNLNTDAIVVTGTSGGGALSTVIAASGNSSDFYESLYEIGAAGISYENGEYVNDPDCGDNVLAVIAYCPITDFRGADMAYEWLFYAAREYMVENGDMSYTGIDDETMLAYSKDLAESYTDYLYDLDIYAEDGTRITTDNLLGYIEELMIAEIEATIEEYTVTYGSLNDAIAAMLDDIATGNGANGYDAIGNTWLTFATDDEGNYTGEFDYDIDQHIIFLAYTTTLKNPNAFSNYGLAWAGRNEDNVFGSETQEYSPFEYMSWQYDSIEGNGVGYDDTKMTWDEYMETAEGEYLSQQLRMTSALEYLTDPQGADIAPYWYVRHGMLDRDTSFAVEASLFYAIENNVEDEVITEANTGFAWLMPHQGDYDVQEAYTWLDEVLNGTEEEDDTITLDIEEALTEGIATKETLNVTVDDEALAVDWYAAPYVSNPNKADDQIINIYIPENATPDSPIMFYVNNSGWQSNSYPTTTITDGTAYVSTSDSDRVGVALSEGYIIVSYGARSRNNAANDDGEYLGHSPATMTDTKAAIRYLRYNAEALDLNTDAIVITGTSGGGALSTVIAASGNSSDFYESLYEIGAAGIEKDENGVLYSVDGLGDNVLAVIAYCPITDFRGADMAYEWLFYDTRVRLVDEADGTQLYDGITNDELLEYSADLKESYETYFNGLGLVDDEGNALTTDNLLDHIKALMIAEFDATLEQYTESEGSVDAAVKAMIADIEGKTAFATVGNNWLIFATDEDGTYTGEYTYDIAEHLYFLANNQTLKVVNAFSNYGLDWGSQNEDNLFGSATDYYSPFEYLSWYLDNVDNEVGYDDTGMEWDEYMDTDAGEYLSMQIRMTSAVDYLVKPGDATPATYWYVRHGVLDRDTSFAVESTLFYSLYSSDAVEDDNINVGFAWLQGHAGNYDVQEAYTWLDEVLPDGPEITVTTSVSSKTITVKVTSDEDAEYTIVLTDEDGEVVDTQTASGTSASVKFTDLTNGDEYTVRVTAKTSDGGRTTKTATATPKSSSSGGSSSGGTSTGTGSSGTTTTTGTFSDVSTDDYYYDAVEWAVANGITTGTSDTTFSP
ncbi:MAG: S-layer homology domain-containing protein, partial [Oscillospiraceae bacterium]|nr:S-layer homology domain-containing protein [Oscillospiraceae bacterium]